MINSILKRHFRKEEEEPVQDSQRPMNVTPEMLIREQMAKEKFIKRAKAKMLGKAICKNSGCQNLRANGSSRCQDCSRKNHVQK